MSLYFNSNQEAEYFEIAPCLLGNEEESESAKNPIDINIDIGQDYLYENQKESNEEKSIYDIEIKKVDEHEKAPKLENKNVKNKKISFTKKKKINEKKSSSIKLLDRKRSSKSKP